jgi:hypothetical protein
MHCREPRFDGDIAVERELDPTRSPHSGFVPSCDTVAAGGAPRFRRCLK